MKKFGKNRSVPESWLKCPIKYILEQHNRGANTSKSSSGHWEVDNSEEEFLGWSNKEANEYITKMYNQGKTENLTLNKRYKENRKKRKPKLSDYLILKWVNEKTKPDKELVVNEIFGNKWCTVGWRNLETGNLGIPRKCRLRHRKGKLEVKYKDKWIDLSDNSGWVF